MRKNVEFENLSVKDMLGWMDEEASEVLAETDVHKKLVEAFDVVGCLGVIFDLDRDLLREALRTWVAKQASRNRDPHVFMEAIRLFVETWDVSPARKAKGGGK